MNLCEKACKPAKRLRHCYKNLFSVPKRSSASERDSRISVFWGFAECHKNLAVRSLGTTFQERREVGRGSIFDCEVSEVSGLDVMPASDERTGL